MMILRASLCLWNGATQLWWEREERCVGVCVRTQCWPFSVCLVNWPEPIIFSFLFLFPFLWCATFPFHCSPIFSSLPFIHPAYNLLRHALLLLAGNLRLQQIVNPVDPLEILADVHWTHIREKEEEEKMVSASKSSTSRGNLPQAPHSPHLDHSSCSCLTLLLLRPSRAVTSAGAAVIERNFFQIALKLHLIKHFAFQVSVCLKLLLSQLRDSVTSDLFVCLFWLHSIFPPHTQFGSAGNQPSVTDMGC